MVAVATQICHAVIHDKLVIRGKLETLAYVVVKLKTVTDSVAHNGTNEHAFAFYSFIKVNQFRKIANVTKLQIITYPATHIPI